VSKKHTGQSTAYNEKTKTREKNTAKRLALDIGKRLISKFADLGELGERHRQRLQTEMKT